MPECTPRQQRVLKTGPLLAVHRFGGAISLLMPYFAKSGVNDGGEPVGFNAAGHWPGTEVMVIPGAFGYLPTGGLYAPFTEAFSAAGAFSNG